MKIVDKENQVVTARVDTQQTVVVKEKQTVAVKVDTQQAVVVKENQVVTVKVGRQIVAVGGSGDMSKSIYDLDDNGVVDEAESLTDGYVISGGSF